MSQRHTQNTSQIKKKLSSEPSCTGHNCKGHFIEHVLQNFLEDLLPYITECFKSLFKLYRGKTNEIQFFKESENQENNKTMFTCAFCFIIF